MLAWSRRPRSHLASVDLAPRWMRDDTTRFRPTASTSSRMAARSSAVSNVCQVPMPTTGTCSEVWPSLRRSSGLFEVLDLHRLDRIGQPEAEDLRVEVQLRLERALDVLRDPEAMLLALERNVGHRQALLAQRVDDGFGLVGWNDLVLQSLEEDHWRRDPIHGVDGGGLSMYVSILGPPAQQALVVHRLELVRIAVKDLQVTDAEMAGSGFEEIGGCQGSQDGVAAGTPSGDRHPVAINQAAIDQVAS